jgi:hypothetical protein
MEWKYKATTRDNNNLMEELYDKKSSKQMSQWTLSLSPLGLRFQQSLFSTSLVDMTFTMSKGQER